MHLWTNLILSQNPSFPAFPTHSHRGVLILRTLVCLILSQCRQRQPTGPQVLTHKKMGSAINTAALVAIGLSSAQETFLPNHFQGFLVHRRGFVACFSAQHSCFPHETGILPQIQALLALKVCLALFRVHFTGPICLGILCLHLPQTCSLGAYFSLDDLELKCKHEHCPQIHMIMSLPTSIDPSLPPTHKHTECTDVCVTYCQFYTYVGILLFTFFSSSL